MKRILLFLSSLLIISLPVVWITPKLDLAFRYLQVLITTRQQPTDKIMQGLFYVSAAKLIPFLLLVLATPKVGIFRRLTGIAVVIVLYFIMDVAMVAIWQVPPFQTPDPTVAHIIVSYAWDMLGRWLLPFLLWIVIAYRQIEELFKGQVETVK